MPFYTQKYAHWAAMAHPAGLCLQNRRMGATHHERPLNTMGFTHPATEVRNASGKNKEYANFHAIFRMYSFRVLHIPLQYMFAVQGRAAAPAGGHSSAAIGVSLPA